jgi:hypothetical protein
VRDEESGQSTLEFSLSAAMLALVLSASGWLLRAEWDRGRCAYLVFEETHARLIGARLRESGFGSRSGVTIEETSQEVRGSGRCGGATELVALPKLESLSW